MAQHDYDIANQSGSAFRADLNNALAAIVTQNSGASAPSTTYAYQIWVDTSTTPATIKLRNASNSGWITTGYVDPSGRVGIGTAPGAYNLEVVAGDTTAGLGYAVRLRANATAAAAALQFTDNVGTTQHGVIAADSSNNLKFFAGTSERARLDGSGRLLLGTTTARTNYTKNDGLTPQIQLEATTWSGSSGGFIRNSTGGGGPNFVLGATRAASVGGNTILASGDELGNFSFQGADGTNLVEGARIQAFVDAAPDLNDMPGRLVFSTTEGGANAPTERLRITQAGVINCSGQRGTMFSLPMPGSGNVRVGAASPGATALSTYDIQDYTAIQFVRDVSGTATQVGTITCALSSTAYNTSSDYRLKENVALLEGAVDRIKQIPVYRFNFIVEPDRTVDGFLAHEVQEVVPEAITGQKDEVDGDGSPVYQGIDQSKLVPLLTAALQEAIERIETIEAKVAALVQPSTT